MLRMIRLHANAVEYLPLALVLMAIYEINGGWHTLLHVVGIALIVGAHAADAGICGSRTMRRLRPHHRPEL